MKTVDVTTQAEFYAEVKKGNRVRVQAGVFVARDNSSVEARGNSSVEAWGNSSVEAWDNSSVEAWDNSSVEARDNSSVEAWGNSSVEARDNSSVEAWGNSSVEAWDNSSVEARGNSSVEARDNSSVEARGNSSVEARDNSSVEAQDNSSVVAQDNSSVVAWGNVFIRAFSWLKIKASINITIINHGKNKNNIKGGNIIKAHKPKTPQEWCDFWGVSVKNNVAAVFKAVNNKYTTDRGTDYSPKSKPEAIDWDGGKAECGGGLHFSPSPKMAKSFFPKATNYMACRISLDDISVHPDGDYPEKIKAKKVSMPCYEVSINGEKL